MLQQTEAPPSHMDTGESRGRRVWRWLGNGLMALVIGAAAVYAHTFVMSEDDLAAPLTTYAATGTVAATGSFSARLDKVVAAKSLKLLTRKTDPDTGNVMVTKTTTIGTRDVFVVATIGATSPGEPTWLSNAWLHTRDGVDHAATDRITQAFTLADRPVQNGWWVDVVFVFEVPPEAFPGASVVVSAPSSNGFYDTIYPARYDQLLPEASLALAKDDAAARQLLNDVKSTWQLTAEG